MGRRSKTRTARRTQQQRIDAKNNRADLAYIERIRKEVAEEKLPTETKPE